MSVTRYKPAVFEVKATATVEPNAAGQYVSYADYATQRAKYDADHAAWIENHKVLANRVSELEGALGVMLECFPTPIRGSNVDDRAWQESTIARARVVLGGTAMQAGKESGND